MSVWVFFFSWFWMNGFSGWLLHQLPNTHITKQWPCENCQNVCARHSQRRIQFKMWTLRKALTQQELIAWYPLKLALSLCLSIFIDEKLTDPSRVCSCLMIYQRGSPSLNSDKNMSPCSTHKTFLSSCSPSAECVVYDPTAVLQTKKNKRIL